MKVIVCGGRDFNDRAKIFAALDQIHTKRTITLLIHGACKGADLIAQEWAILREVDYCGYPAKWKQFGNSAGPIRNGMMLNKHPDAECLISFPGGHGTEDMKRQAKSREMKVLDASKLSIFKEV